MCKFADFLVEAFLEFYIMMKHKSLITLFFVLSFSFFGFAQVPTFPVVTTVDSTFINLESSYIFVTIKNNFISKDSSGCLGYDLRFRLENKGELVGYPPIIVEGIIKSDSDEKVGNDSCRVCSIDNRQFIHCKDTMIEDYDIIAKLRAKDTIMSGITKSYYNLAFRLPYGTTKEDSLSICIEQGLSSIVCKGCALGGFDRELNPERDVPKDCPYQGDDVLACSKRQSRVENWEAWIMDKRDCKIYRTVQMPDDRWWLAQNLNYHGMLNKPLKYMELANEVAEGSTDPVRVPQKTFWCPGGTPSHGGGTVLPDGTRADRSSLAACKIYGALYPWTVVMTTDGYFNNPTSLSRPLDFDVSSTTRGVCPDGWYVPSSLDWGTMINMIEKDCDTLYKCPSNGDNFVGGTSTTVPCYHNIKSAHSEWTASSCAFKDLLSTHLAPTIVLDGKFDPSLQVGNLMPNNKLGIPYTIHTYADNTNPAWNYFSSERSGTDRYGFSLLPSGVRAIFDGRYYFYYRGEFSGFWTASGTSGTHTSSITAQMRGFRYNYMMDNFLGAIQSYSITKVNGYGLRCIAKKT
ncbi:MAG: FISUMP domain-containing protein [Bacteroidales bacterium]